MWEREWARAEQQNEGFSAVFVVVPIHWHASIFLLSAAAEETEKNMIIWIPLIYIWKKEAENATVSGPPQWQWKCIHKHGKMCSRWVVLDCVHVILLPLLLHDLCSGLSVYENTMNNCEEEKLTATLAHLRIDNNKNNEFLFYENRSGDSLSVIRRLLCCCWS